MLNYNNNSKRYFKKSSKFLNNISSQYNSNSFLLDNLISDLYLYLLSLVPKKIARKASINSRDAFEYFLIYSVEEIKLTIKKEKYNWVLNYKVYPSYLYNEKKIRYNYKFSDSDILINLKDFYEKNAKKYCN